MKSDPKDFHSNYFLVSAEKSPEGLYFVDKNRKIIFWNEKAEEITGYKKDEVLGKHCFNNILEHTDDRGKNLCLNKCPLVEAVETGIPQFKKVFLKTKTGSRIPISVEVFPVKAESNEIIGAVEFFSESFGLKEIKQKIRALERRAYLDPLTQIPNRRLFEIVLRKFFEKYRQNNQSFGLIFLDLDNFKFINDFYGHIYGDAALKAVAQTIISNIKPSDLAARYGGDEFVILLDNINYASLKRLTEKLYILIGTSSFKHKNLDIPISASLGATIVRPEDTKSSIIKRADELMLKAKRKRKKKIVVER